MVLQPHVGVVSKSAKVSRITSQLPTTAQAKDEAKHLRAELREGGIKISRVQVLARVAHRQELRGWNTICAINQMRILGRWMRLIAIPNQSSIPKAFQEFDAAGRMRPSPLYDRIVDVMEEPMKFNLLTRDRADYFVDRYSEHKESVEALMKRLNLSAAT